jgi:2-aminobenzoate-CoA ligase
MQRPNWKLRRFAHYDRASLPVKSMDMKDRYPSGTTIPASRLVEADLQPDYSPYSIPRPDQSWNVGYRLADLHVAEGRGDLFAAIHAETDRHYTFTDLARESTRLAAGLVGLGVRPGDRIAYRTTNDPDAIVLMLAVWKAGGVLVPVPAQAKSTEIRHFIVDTGARLLFVHGHAGPLDDAKTAVAESSITEIIGFGAGHEGCNLRSWNELKRDQETALPTVDPDQVAIIWHTGGTTGVPKGCYHTHRRFLIGGYAFGEGTGASVGQRWMAAAPIGHALGIIHCTIFSMLHGATVVFVEQYPDPKALLTAVAKHKVTTLTALMASWAKMAEVARADAGVDISSLRRCFAMWQSASSSEVFDFWLSRGVELLNNFGSTSFATWVLVPPLGVASPRAALGRALPGYQVEAVELANGKVSPVKQGFGRMAVRGPTGLTYWNLPELQKRDVVDGWTLSDDLIEFDDEGNAHYLGRTDYMISTAGYKVAPVEVEQVLSRHAAVREVCVVPAPCPTRHEIVVAYVVLLDGYVGDNAIRNELLTIVKSELASYKAPRRIEFIDALPRDAVGKVQTKIVKQWASATPGETSGAGEGA